MFLGANVSALVNGVWIGWKLLLLCPLILLIRCVLQLCSSRLPNCSAADLSLVLSMALLIGCSRLGVGMLRLMVRRAFAGVVVSMRMTGIRWDRRCTGEASWNWGLSWIGRTVLVDDL